MNIESAIDNLILIGGNDLALRVLALYQELVPARLEALLSQFSQANIQEISQLAHSIKSSAGNLGLQDVYDSAQVVESIAFESSQDNLAADVKKLESAIADSLIELKSWEQKLTC